MENFIDKEYTADYLALKAENDRLREESKQWLMNTLDLLCNEINSKLPDKTAGAVLQVGRQDWRFNSGDSIMIGERFGARYRNRTLVVEAGWPRLAEHGFVPDGGLARARVGLSQNIMLEALTVAELILKRHGKDAPSWYVIVNNKIGERVTEYKLRSFLLLLLKEDGI
jgi:hypothetical protein